MGFKEYIEERFNVRPVGGGRQWQLMGECPFCGAKDKVYIDPERGVGICFKCSGFSAVKFVMAQEKCTYRKAKAMLESGDPERFLSAPEERVEGGVWFPKIEPLTEKALEYLAERNIGPELIEHFKLYSCTTDTVVHGETKYTKDRIIIPICDSTGQPWAWVGRAIYKNPKRKYLFPDGFTASEYLYNVHTIPEGVPYLIICEGVFDAFGWWRAGFKNVVATFGKKASDYQVGLIRKLNPGAVFVAWDGDALKEAYGFCEKYGHYFNTRVINLGPHDADELKPSELVEIVAGAKAYSFENKLLSLI